MTKYTVLRTPEHNFDGLPGYDYSPNYFEVDGLRIHYLDEGDKSAEPIFLPHGEPSWSYLYRKMIDPLVDGGFRVIAPDLVGFGKSDKLASRKDHSYQRHVNWMTALVEDLNLNHVNLFGQDWGGLIGLRIVGRHPQLFKRIIVGNTGFPFAGGLSGLIGKYIFKLKILMKGKVTQEDLEKDTNFMNWVAYSQTVPDFPVGQIVQGATVTELDQEIVDAYDAPFPDESYKEGPRVLPALVPSQLRKNKEVWDDVLSKWNKPFLISYSDSDPITGGFKKSFERIPGAQGQEHVTIKDAGHFLQEDKGEELAREIINFISEN